MALDSWEHVRGPVVLRRTTRSTGSAPRPSTLPLGPATGDVSRTPFALDGNWDNVEIHYLETGGSSSAISETIIMRPHGDKVGPILITQDHGKSWTQPKELEGESIWQIIPHYHFRDMVFFVTFTEKVIYTVDRGLHFHTFKAPYKPATGERRMPLAFHPDKKDWLLWMGDKCDDEGCYPAVSYTKDRGDQWQTGARYAKQCEFTGGTPVQKVRQARQESDRLPAEISRRCRLEGTLAAVFHREVV